MSTEREIHRLSGNSQEIIRHLKKALTNGMVFICFMIIIYLYLKNAIFSFNIKATVIEIAKTIGPC